MTGTYKKTRDIDPADLRGNLASDIWELRGILREAGYDRNVVNTQLHELIRQNKLNGNFEK